MPFGIDLLTKRLGDFGGSLISGARGGFGGPGGAATQNARATRQPVHHSLPNDFGGLGVPQQPAQPPVNLEGGEDDETQAVRYRIGKATGDGDPAQVMRDAQRLVQAQQAARAARMPVTGTAPSPAGAVGAVAPQAVAPTEAPAVRVPQVQAPPATGSHMAQPAPAGIAAPPAETLPGGSTVDRTERIPVIRGPTAGQAPTPRTREQQEESVRAAHQATLERQISPQQRKWRQTELGYARGELARMRGAEEEPKRKEEAGVRTAEAGLRRTQAETATERIKGTGAARRGHDIAFAELQVKRGKADVGRAKSEAEKNRAQARLTDARTALQTAQTKEAPAGAEAERGLTTAKAGAITTGAGAQAELAKAQAALVAAQAEDVPLTRAAATAHQQRVDAAQAKVADAQAAVGQAQAGQVTEQTKTIGPESQARIAAGVSEAERLKVQVDSTVELQGVQMEAIRAQMKAAIDAASKQPDPIQQAQQWADIAAQMRENGADALADFLETRVAQAAGGTPGTKPGIFGAQQTYTETKPGEVDLAGMTPDAAQELVMRLKKKYGI